jgi:predicted dehydrogenase
VDQLRIGMIGVRGRGGLWKNWHKPQGGRSVFVAGMDVRDDTLARFRDENGSAPFGTKDYQELLARPDIDAVAVCSPDYCHEEHALAVLQAGKHPFLEKPMAITTEGCDRILTAWQQSGVRMMSGFNMRYTNLYSTSSKQPLRGRYRPTR